METVTLKIKNKNKYQHFIKFIKDLDYVEVLDKNKVIEEKDNGNESDFFALSGMWKDRGVSAESIRSKVWPKRK